MQVGLSQNQLLENAFSKTSQQKLDAVRAGVRPKVLDKASIDKAAEEFESVFLSQMMQHMFSGIETDSLFGGGNAEKIYKSMMVDEFGKVFAKNGGIGIATHVKQELLKLQEVA